MAGLWEPVLSEPLAAAFATAQACAWVLMGLRVLQRLHYMFVLHRSHPPADFDPRKAMADFFRAEAVAVSHHEVGIPRHLAFFVVPLCALKGWRLQVAGLES
jgi:hypothetical protein